MNIEAGKLYQTRDGQKVRIYATDGQKESGYPIHGAVLYVNGWRMENWASSGYYYDDGCEDKMDIIGPWVEQPIVDWSAMPKWVVGVFCNPQCNRWFGYTADNRPVKRDLCWETPNTLYLAEIPTDFFPKDGEGKPWSGDWQECIVERPEGE